MKRKKTYQAAWLIAAVCLMSGCNAVHTLNETTALETVKERQEETSEPNKKPEQKPETARDQTEKINGEETELPQVFEVEDYGVRFFLPEEMEDVTEGSPYDLQCFGKNYYFSVLAYQDIDLPEGETPASAFESWKEELFSRRTHVKLIKEKSVLETENKVIETELYSGEKDGIKNYYYCCVIDFKEPSDIYAWILFTGTPSVIEHDLDTMAQILLRSEVINQ